MNPIRIAIIGCGVAAKRYYLPALKSCRPYIEDVYFVDSNIRNAQELKDELGWGRISECYEDITHNIQGAVVVVPHFLHYRVVMDLIKAGIHVLCEKPLAESTDQAKEMIKAAEDNGIFLCTNYTRRMFSSFCEVKRILAKKELGRPLSIKYIEGNTFAWPSTTGFYVNPHVSDKGILLDLGPHVIDTLCWWLGAKPELISYDDDSYGGPESVVKIHARLDSCKIEVILNRLCDLANTYTITCENGRIDGKIFDWGRLHVIYNSGKTIQIKIKNNIRSYPAFVTQIFKNYINVLRRTEKPYITGEDVIGSVKFIQECYALRKSYRQSVYGSDSIQFSHVKGKLSRKNVGKTLVTGATGFIGGHIVEKLHLSGMRDVRATIRQWSSAARLGRLPVDIAMVDLMNKEQIDMALRGVTKIIHCAKGTAEVTVEGTRNLLECALKRDIKKIVYLSTADVYGDVTGKIDEQQPLQYTGSEYNRMKIDSEKICWEYSRKGLPLIVIRPSIVYGPFSRNWTIRFATMILAGEMALYETFGEGKCNLIYIDDLVKVILDAIESENGVNHAFNVNGPEVVTWNEYFLRFNKIMGLGPLKTIQSTRASIKTTVVEPVRKLGGFVKNHFMSPLKRIAEHIEIADTLMRKIEHTIRITPGPDELKLFNKNVIFSCEKARDLLAFDPSIDVEKGLTGTMKWLQGQGYRIKS